MGATLIELLPITKHLFSQYIGFLPVHLGTRTSTSLTPHILATDHRARPHKMDGNGWEDDDQSFADGYQQRYNGNQQSQNRFQQPQYGGQQQQYRPTGQRFQGAQQSQFGQQQQQQYGGQHFQTGSQQQQYEAQQFPTRGQQAYGGQFGVGGHHQLNIPAQQSSTGLAGRQFSSISDNNQNSSGAFSQTAAWTSNQRNVSAPNAPQNLPYELDANQQTAGNPPRQQFLQVPMATRGPSGQQGLSDYTSRQSSGNSVHQQILPRHRPLGSPPQSMNGQQHNMGNTQQIPMAMRATSQQFSRNSFNPRFLPRHQLQSRQSQFPGGQQQHLNNTRQFSPSASQFQTDVQRQYLDGHWQFIPGQRQFSGNSQQFSPTAAQFQPGLQQHFASGSLNTGIRQIQAIRQTSAASQQFSPSALQLQPGAQQHFANSQPVPLGARYQGQHNFSQGQLGPYGPNFNPSLQLPQQSTDGYPLQNGQENTTAHQLGAGQQPTGVDSQYLCTTASEAIKIMDKDNGVDGNRVAREANDGAEDPHRHALQATEQYLDQNSTTQGRNDDQPVPKDMVVDPLYQQMLLQVQEWKELYNVPMTEDQQARLAAQETWKQKDSIKGGKRLAELDEDDLDDDIIEEAVRDAKRQRIRHEHLNFHANAHKVYVQGPENKPEGMDVDKDSADDDQVTSFDLDLEILGLTPEFKGEFSGKTLSLAENPFKKPYEHQVFDRNFRLIESICCDWTFMIEVTKHLRVKDIIMLYSVSKTFHDLVNLRFQSTIAAWAQEISPSGWKVFYWKFYGNLAMKDPAGKLWAMPGPVTIPRPAWAPPARAISMTHQVRSVPSLKYLAMLAQRERRTRDILACLARAGHRLPETTHVTLKKIWMLMDISTNILRRAFIRNENIWTPHDLYNAQMFYVKLQMRFNEPIFGPKSTVLADTFLGLRDGLNPLWRLLRRKAYLGGEEILQQRLKYYCRESVVQHHLLIGHSFIGIHPSELGNEHKEGWGGGKVHLSRPDELVIEECVRRHLGMEKHIVFMMFWGHVDWKKRLNLVPSEEEMYMSDDELPPLPKTGKYAAHGMWGKCGNVPFEFDNWQPKHSMKARWKTLTREEKLAVIKHDRDEQMRALPFEKDVGEKFWDLPYNANDRAHPDYPDGIPSQIQESESESEPEDLDGDTQMGEAGDEERDSENGVDDDPEGEEEGSVIVKYEYTYEDDALSIPDHLEDEKVIIDWYDLDPYLQQKIIDEHERVGKQDEKDERTLAIIYNDEMEKQAKAEAEAQQNGESSAATGPSTAVGPSNQSSGQPSPYSSPMKKKPKRYRYPGITDPISLALLERYDRFAPEEFRTDEAGNILREQQGSSSGSSSSNTTNRLIELSDYDKYDDDELKALADEEYDSDQVDFDLDSYQKFLTRVGDDGGFKGPDADDADDDSNNGRAEVEVKRKKDFKGKGKAIAVESSDDEYDDDGDEMAYEGDLDDELPLPKYDFRKF